jgi:Ca2+-binding EF-hand superfamily protein
MGVFGPAVFELTQDADPLTLVGLASGPPRRDDDDAVVLSDSAGAWKLEVGTPSLSRVVATLPRRSRGDSRTMTGDSPDASELEDDTLSQASGRPEVVRRRTEERRGAHFSAEYRAAEKRLPRAQQGPFGKLVNGLGARRPGTPGPTERERESRHKGLNKRGFSEEQFDDLRTAFKTFCDQNNEVPVFRFYSLCLRIGFKIPESVIAKRMEVIDADGSGTISLQEFIDAARRLYDEERLVEEAVASSGWPQEEADSHRTLFLEADEDGSGDLGQDELQPLCEELGFALTLEQIAELMAPYDADGSGTIDFPEFLHFLKDASVLFEQKFVLDEDSLNDGAVPQIRVVTDWATPIGGDAAATAGE